MERRERINSFGWNLLIVFSLFIVICLVSVFSKSVSPMQYGFVLAWCLVIGSVIPGGFLCGLILKGEEIRGLVRGRADVTIRKAWIFLSIVTFLLAGAKLWLPAFFRFIVGGKVNLPLFLHSISLDHHGDIVLGVTAALFLVGAFQMSRGQSEQEQVEQMQEVQGVASKDATHKEGTAGLVIWNLFAVLCVLVSIYLIYKFNWYLLEHHPDYGRYGLNNSRWNTLPRAYYLILAQIAATFICALLIQGEEIVKIVRQRRNLLFRWEMLILSAMSLFFAHMHFSLPGHFSKVVFAFAAAVLLIRVFHVKALPSDLQDGPVKEGERL